MESLVQIEETVDNSVNRFRKCPMQVRIYYSYGEHGSLLSYRRGVYPKNCIVVFIWMNTTLDEIVSHLKMSERKIRRRGTILDFQIVSLGAQTTRQSARDAGRVCIGVKRPENTKTLNQCRFSVGDIIDVNVTC